jgi:hypothetical protein
VSVQVLTQEDRPTRDFAVTVFLVHQGRVGLIYDELARALLPPAGHIRPEELPAEAARRVVMAQTGIPADLLAGPAPEWAEPALLRPEGLLLERVTPSHEHVSLVYFARPAPGFRPRLSEELPFLRWFDLDALGRLDLPTDTSRWAALAIERESGRA